MTLKNIILSIACCFAFSAVTFAQDQTKDRFSYSYGILLGDNLQKLGLSNEVVSTNKLLEGALDFFSKKDKRSDKETQQVVNIKLQEINDNNKAKAEGKAGKEWTKAELVDFSYEYGMLIGANWSNFGVNPEEIDQSEFKKGLTDMLKGNGATLSAEEAQSEVTAKYQLILQEKEAQTLASNKAFFAENKKKATVSSLASGIQYEVLTKGSGQKATAATNVTTHYHGMLLDGSVFDSSVNRGEPISFALTGVIKGWQEIIPMMNVGGKWKVYIPSHLAYGSRARGKKIPANSLLVFEIELISVQ